MEKRRVSPFNRPFIKGFLQIALNCSNLEQPFSFQCAIGLICLKYVRLLGKLLTIKALAVGLDRKGDGIYSKSVTAQAPQPQILTLKSLRENCGYNEKPYLSAQRLRRIKLHVKRLSGVGDVKLLAKRLMVGSGYYKHDGFHGDEREHIFALHVRLGAEAEG